MSRFRGAVFFSLLTVFFLKNNFCDYGGLKFVIVAEKV